MPTVVCINFTPVKSTALRQPDHIRLEETGVEADRRFLFLEADGGRLSGEMKAPLFGIVASHDPLQEKLSLGLPDGTRVRGPARPTGPAFKVSMYDREIEVRAVPGPLADAVSRYLGRPVQLVRVQTGERGGGAAPVSILSRPAVEELGRRAGRPTPDPRRFRMLVELDECEPHVEDGWAGLRVRMGEALVRVGEPAIRCSLTDLDPDTGRKDFPTVDTLATYRRNEDGVSFGRYATIVEAGTVRIGDAVAVED
jgi:uncharacterized protein YcbX